MKKLDLITILINDNEKAKIQEVRKVKWMYF